MAEQEKSESAAKEESDIVGDAKSPEEKKEHSNEDGASKKEDRPGSPDTAKGGSFEDLDDDDNSALYKQHNWPLEGIKEPHENDVLYGRGGGTNHHPGNKRYRKQVEEKKVEYVNSKRLEKPLVALNIIRKWRRDQVPPGRFLKINDKTGLWDDVGDKKAREKTSQALREKAPVLRKQQEELDSEMMQPHVCIIDHGAEEGYYDETDVFDEGETSGSGYTPLQIERKGVVQSSVPSTAHGEYARREKSTRFATGTKSPAPSKLIARPAFGLRLHSLGTETPDEDTLRGFSWDKPVFGDSNMALRTSAGPSQQRQLETYGDFDNRSASKIQSSASEDHGILFVQDDMKRPFPRRSRNMPKNSYLEDEAKIGFESAPPYSSAYNSGGYRMRNSNGTRHAASYDDSDIPYRLSRDVSEEEHHFRELSMRRRLHGKNVGRSSFDGSGMGPSHIDGHFHQELSTFPEERMTPDPNQDPKSMDRVPIGENFIDVPPPPSPYSHESREHSFAEFPFEKYRRRPSFPPDQTSLPHTSFIRTSTNPYHPSESYRESMQSPYSHDEVVHDGSIHVMEREMEIGRSFDQTEAESPFQSQYRGKSEFGEASDGGRFEFVAGSGARFSNGHGHRRRNGRYTSTSPVDSIGSKEQFSDPEFRFMNPDKQFPSSRNQLRVIKSNNSHFSGASNLFSEERKASGMSTPSKNVIRPLMKRDTSHQAEKPDVKKDTKMRRAVRHEFDIRQSSPMGEPEHHRFDPLSSTGDDVAPPAQHHNDNDLLDHVAEESLHRLAPSMAEISLNNARSPLHWQDMENPVQREYSHSPGHVLDSSKPVGFSMADRATTLEKLGSLLDDKEPADDFENAASWLDEVSPEGV